MISIIISVVLILVVVAIDQLSKYFIVSQFDMIQSIYVENIAIEDMQSVLAGLPAIEIIPDWLQFRLVLNDGMALGMLDNARWVFMTLSTVAIAGILVYMFWKKPQNKLLLASLILITGGGIGNMIDRIAFGYVIDFIDFCRFPNLWMWVFNVADSCVCIGAGIMALWLILDMIKEMKADKAKKLAEETAVAREESATESTDSTNGDENE